MATYLRPGVYVQETLNPLQPVAGPASSTVAAFVGANDRGPVVPTLVTSWSQYVNLFGSWNTIQNNNLPLGVYMYFANGGSAAYVTRVAGASAAQATRIFQDTEGTPANTLQIKAINAGTWGNNLNISITASTITGYFNIVVYYGGSTAGYIVEQWTDVSMTATDSRYAINVVNNNSTYITAIDSGATATGATRNPSVVANASLSSGSDGSAVTGANLVTALSLYDTIRQSLVLNIPGYTDATTINGAISYATGATRPNDVFVVIDGINDTVANQLTLSATYTQTSYAAVYYPQLTIADPTVGVGSTTGAVKTVGAGAAVVGLYAATDASRGVFKAPAGLQARLAGVVSVPSFSMADLDSLNSAAAPVNAIRFISGSGIVVFGARTLKGGYVDRYVPVRRSLIYIEKSLRDLTHFAVFEPNDQRLWSRINASVSAFLTAFWSQGGLSGATPGNAYFILCDATNNPQSSIDNGIVNIQVGVALQRPAEFVIINIGQYSGGTTVTVA
jgi:hypothetical protein